MMFIDFPRILKLLSELSALLGHILRAHISRFCDAVSVVVLCFFLSDGNLTATS